MKSFASALPINKIRSLALFMVPVLLTLPGFCLAGVVDISGLHSLENGLDVRLMHEPSTSVVATMVLVKTGYAAEGATRSGFSHLLEHLVFAGTEERSRHEIQKEVKDLGGYINGFTRDDYTGYLIVGHREHLPDHLEILADMLFHSTVPEQAVQEAKEVVLEEIRQMRSRPGTREELLFQSLLYEGSPYARTGLGNETTVSAVSRDEIYDFYRNTYCPNNMILLIKGGFDTEDVRSWIEGTFGTEPMGPEVSTPIAPASLSAQRSYLLGSVMPDVKVRIGFEGPDPKSGDVEAVELLLGVLGGVDGVLDKALKGAGMKPRSVSASLSVNAGFSRIILSAVLPGWSDPTSVQRVFLEAVPAALTSKYFPQWTTEAKEMMVAEQVLGREKLHYYLMGVAPWVVAASPGQGVSPGRWDDLDHNSLLEAARRYLVDMPYVALLTLPESRRKTAIADIKGSVKAQAMLDNGLSVTAEQRPGSPVFAMHVMTRHRSTVEPREKEGIADFLHRLLPLGTYNRGREDLESELRAHGISLSTAGNPMLPFGDFYTSRLYSWIRLECVMEKADKASTLLAEMIKTPLLSADAVEEVRGQMLSFIAYNAASPDRVASRLLAQILYGEVLSSDVYGSEESISGITREDLQKFHREYFTGRNIIITVVSGMSPEQSLALVERLFSDLPPGNSALHPPPPALTAEPVVTEVNLAKPQGAYAAGAVSGLIRKKDAPALDVTSGWLNTRFMEVLREREGLAYSIRVSMEDVDGRAVFTFSMGTAPGKLKRAQEALREQINIARDEQVTEEEIQREVNGLVGRLQMRMLSSINRAFYLGLADRKGLTHSFSEDYRQSLLTVKSWDVERMLNAYLPGEDLVEAIVR